MRFAALLGLAAFSITVAGCGRPTGSVTGKVSYLVKQLKGGTVVFISTEGLPSATATIREDGTYEISDIKTGSYKIVVDTESLIVKNTGSTMKGPAMGPKDGKKMGPPPGAQIPEGYTPSSSADADATLKSNAKRYVKIPLNYGKAEESGLVYTVVPGPQTHDIELK